MRTTVDARGGRSAGRLHWACAHGPAVHHVHASWHQRRQRDRLGVAVAVALGASLAGCYSPAPGAAPNVLEVRNETSAVVHVSWPIGVPPDNQQGDFDVPAHGVATYGCGASIDAAFVIDGRTVEQTITSPFPGATLHVEVLANGTVQVVSVTTTGP